jgi:spermidine/putrescine transport system ATP-binding protein
VEAPLIRLSGVSKRYGSVSAVHPTDLDIGYGEFFALLGPSGCGKTTLLRMIGGFLAPSSGRVDIAGKDVTHLGPEKRDTNMVFQGYGLFPHMTVRQNVSYGLRLRKRPAAEIDAAVGDMLALVHLSDYADRLPKLLSGGQQQRVALARALVMQPKVLLLAAR